MKLKILLLAGALAVSAATAPAADNALTERVQTLAATERPLELPESLTAALLSVEDSAARAELAEVAAEGVVKRNPLIAPSIVRALATVDPASAAAFAVAVAVDAPQVARELMETLVVASPETTAASFTRFSEKLPESSAVWLAIASQGPMDQLFAICELVASMESGRSFRGNELGDWLADRVESKLTVEEKRNRILDQMIVFQSKVRLIQSKYGDFRESTRELLGSDGYGNLAELIARQVIQVDLFDQGAPVETAFLNPETLVAPAFITDVPAGLGLNVDVAAQLQNLADALFTNATVVTDATSVTTVTDRNDRVFSRNPATSVAP